MNHSHIHVLLSCASTFRSMFGGSIRRRVEQKQRGIVAKAYPAPKVYLQLNSTDTTPNPLPHKCKYNNRAMKPARINTSGKPKTIAAQLLRKEVHHVR